MSERLDASIYNNIIHKTQNALTLVYSGSNYVNELYATTYSKFYNYSAPIANLFSGYPIINTLISAELSIKTLSLAMKGTASIAGVGYGCAAYVSHLWEGISAVYSSINLGIIVPLYDSNLPGIDKALIFTGRVVRYSHDTSLYFAKLAQNLKSASNILTKTSSLIAVAAPTNIMFTTLNTAQTVAIAHPVSAGVIVLGGTIIGTSGLVYYLYKNNHNQGQLKSKAANLKVS